MQFVRHFHIVRQSELRAVVWVKILLPPSTPGSLKTSLRNYQTTRRHIAKTVILINTSLLQPLFLDLSKLQQIRYPNSFPGHLERMEEDRMPKKIFTQELEGTRGRGRPRKGWKEEVERDLQVLGVRRWRELVADRKKMEGHCSTGQSPQWALVPMEEEQDS